MVETISQSPSVVASLQKSYFSDYDSPAGTDNTPLVISMPSSPTPLPGTTIKRRPSPLDLADIGIGKAKLDLEIQTARSDVSTSYTPNIATFAWSPSRPHHHQQQQSIDTRNSLPLCSPAPTTESSFGPFIMHSPRHQSDIRFGLQSPTASPRLVEELRKELTNLSKENQSLSLENQLLREALDIDQGGDAVAELMERMTVNAVEEKAGEERGESELGMLAKRRNFLGSIDAGKGTLL